MCVKINTIYFKDLFAHLDHLMLVLTGIVLCKCMLYLSMQHNTSSVEPLCTCEQPIAEISDNETNEAGMFPND